MSSRLKTAKPLLALVAFLCGGALALPTAPSEERFVAGEALTLDVPLDTAAFLRGGYPIDSAGYADIPIVGRIYVAGKTRTEVEEYLGGKLSNSLRDTHLRAIPAIRITFLGHFVRQGQYFVSPKATLWDATYLAGGMAGERTLDKLEVMRGEKTLPISFLDEYSGNKTLLASGVRSGDIFMMPVPRDNTGFWYYFRESLTVTAQIATVATTVVTTYLLLEQLRFQREDRAARDTVTN
jgi:protein involved in polysaccharide export with SLBB domain